MNSEETVFQGMESQSDVVSPAVISAPVSHEVFPSASEEPASAHDTGSMSSKRTQASSALTNPFPKRNRPD